MCGNAVASLVSNSMPILCLSLCS